MDTKKITNLLNQFLDSLKPQRQTLQGQTASTQSLFLQESDEIPGLFYIFEPEAEKLELITASYAQKRGLLHIKESGNVPQLVVEILSPEPALFVEGDVLLGGMQNRVVDATVILSRGVHRLPVRCVEKGRWHLTRSPRFEDSSFSMPADVLKEKFSSGIKQFKITGNYRSDQGTVWNSVQKHLHEKKIRSATSDLSASFHDNQPSSALKPLSKPSSGQSGFLFYLNRHQAVLEKVATPELWADRHEKFIKSIVMERAKENVGRSKIRLHAIEEAESFVSTILNDLSLTPGKKPPVGVGAYHVLDHQGVRAHALSWKGRHVHVRCFLN